MPDWSAVLAAPPANVSTFNDGAFEPRGPDGRPLDLADLTVERQRESDERDGTGVFGADAPQWRLFAHAPMRDLLPSRRLDLPIYLVVWVADDGVDGDGDAARDVNETILVHAQAFGIAGARRSVEAAVSRSADGVLSSGAGTGCTEPVFGDTFWSPDLLQFGSRGLSKKSPYLLQLSGIYL